MKKGLLIRCSKHVTSIFSLLFLSLCLNPIFSQSFSISLQVENIDCGNFETGSILATPSGGTAPYTYLWNTGATSNPVNNLPVGTYSLVVTDDTGATATATATITAPPPLNVVITQLTCSLPGAMTANVTGGVPPYMYMWSNGENTPTISDLAVGQYCVTVMDANACGWLTCESVGPLLEVEVETTPVICGTASGGTATAIVNGGVPPFTYAWSNGDSTQVIDSLMQGIYTVTVTAENDCTDTASETVQITPGDFLIDMNTTGPTCPGNNDGTITASAFNGLAPYTYEWSNGASGATVSGLAPGTYIVTVTDAVGCTDTESATLEYQSLLAISLDGTNPTCADLNDGSVTVFPSDGVPPYSYQWGNGATTQTINNLGAGTYTVSVMDAVGCEVSGSFSLTSPPQLEIELTVMDASNCGESDGVVSASVLSGGTPPYSYSWNTGATTSSLFNVVAGTYSVTVTSSEGCSATGSETIGQPNTLLVGITGSNLVCGDDDDGSLTANVTYGTAPYSFEWSNGTNTQSINNLPAGTYSVTVTSSEGCSGQAMATINQNPEINLVLDAQNLTCFENSTGQVNSSVSGGTPPFVYIWSNGANTPSIFNLPIGTYTLTVMDAEDCIASASVTLTQPDELTLDVDAMNGSCGVFGVATANVSGGTLPYSYSWSTGASTESIQNLPAGNYSLTVTDANGCSASANFDIEVSGTPMCEVFLTQPISSLNGDDGQLTVVPSGGNAPYTYLWSDGQTTPMASGLSAGIFAVTVTDSEDCPTVCSFELLNPAKLGDFVWLDENMNGIQDPSENGLEGVVAILSGTDDYGNAVNASTSTDATGMYMFLVQPGSYKVTFNVPTNFVLTNNDEGTDDSIDSDVNPTTNMTPFYTLAPGETNLTIDAGLFESPCINVTDPGEICCDQVLCGPGNVPDPLFETIPATGGDGPLEYLWMFSNEPGPFTQGSYTPISSATGPNYAPGTLYETTYFVRCVRREGCSMYLESNIITITVDDDAVAEINGPSSTCVGDENNFFSSANDPGATYLWNFGDGIPSTANTEFVNGVVWNNYGVKTITLEVENNGCTSYDTLQIFVSNSPAFCGNALVISGEAMNETSISISWDYLAPDTSGLTFSVEWSLDAINFFDIGNEDIAAQNTMGWEFEKMHYEAQVGTNYYRIKVADQFGQTVYSSVMKVELEEVSSIENNYLSKIIIYPNPFGDHLTIDLNESNNQPITFKVYDTVGKNYLTYELKRGTSRFNIPTGQLPSGVYFGIIRTENNEQRIIKLIK